MNNNIWITVPTYWGENVEEKIIDCVAFDHPTFPFESETLSRTLKSLDKLNDDFNILIILAVTNKEFLSSAKNYIQRMMKEIHKNVFLICDEEIGRIKETVNTDLFKLNSYGNIRNIQLLVPYCYGCKYVIAIDDDEIIDDQNFVNKIVSALDNEKFASGLSGIYLNKNKEYKIEGAEKLKNETIIFKRKAYLIDSAMRKEMQHSENFHPSILAFGGNMSFKRSLISKVCHDPFISRGEDADYVLNAYLFNELFYFKKDVPIIHLPPSAGVSNDNSNLKKLEADIIRFIYINRKIRKYIQTFDEVNFDKDLFYPYPGDLIFKEDLVINDARKLLKDIFDKNDKEIDEYIKEIIIISDKKSADYFTYREQWEKFLKDSDNLKKIRGVLAYNI